MNIIQLLDDDDMDVPSNNTGRRGRTLSRRVPGSRMPRSSFELVVQPLNDPARASVSFANPLSTDQPSTLTAQASDPIVQVQVPTPPVQTPAPSSRMFAAYPIPEDQVGAAKEARILAGLMTERLKVVYDTIKAYNTSSALQANVQVSGIVS